MPGFCRCVSATSASISVILTSENDSDLRKSSNRKGNEDHRWFRPGSKWPDVPNISKRWTLYWWYSVNIFQMRQECGPLPRCVEIAIKNEYPNRHGVKYIGFIPTEERKNKRSRKLVSGVNLGPEPTVPGSLKEDV